jgi:hypothetical protein
MAKLYRSSIELYDRDFVSSVKTATSRYGEPRVQDRVGYRSRATSGVNPFLGLIYVMLAHAIVIALMGISNTLSLSIPSAPVQLALFVVVEAVAERWPASGRRPG